MKTFDDYLSPQAKASRKIEPCYDPAGALIRSQSEDPHDRDCPWMVGEDVWEARNQYIKSTSRGGGTTDFS